MNRQSPPELKQQCRLTDIRDVQARPGRKRGKRVEERGDVGKGTVGIAVRTEDRPQPVVDDGPVHSRRSSWCVRERKVSMNQVQA